MLFREAVAIEDVGRGQARRIESGDGLLDRFPPLIFERVEPDLQPDVLLRVEQDFGYRIATGQGNPAEELLAGDVARKPKTVVGDDARIENRIVRCIAQVGAGMSDDAEPVAEYPFDGRRAGVVAQGCDAGRRNCEQN